MTKYRNKIPRYAIEYIKRDNIKMIRKGLIFMNTAALAKTDRRTQRMQTRKRKALLADLAAAKRELDNAAENLNFVKDDLLLEHFIFRMKASEMRYRYLLCLARDMENEFVCEGNDTK